MSEGQGSSFRFRAMQNLFPTQVVDPRVRDVRLLRRCFAFADPGEADAFAEAYLAIDRFSTDHASFFEIRLTLMDGDVTQALRFFDDVHAAARRAGTPADRSRAGEALRFKAQILAAVDRHAALALLQAAAEHHGDSALLMASLGRSLCSMNRSADAIGPLRQAADAAHATQDWQTLSLACNLLSNALLHEAQYDQALHHAQRNVRAAHATANSGADWAHDWLADAMAHYAAVHAEANDLAAAEPYMTRAEATWHLLGTRQPAARIFFARKAAHAWLRVAFGCGLADQVDEAHTATTRAVELLDAEAAVKPDDKDLQSDLAQAYLHVALAERSRGNLGLAVSALRRAAALRNLLLHCDRDGDGTGQGAAHAESALGRVYLHRGEFDSAAAAFDRALAHWRDTATAAKGSNHDLHVFALTLVQRASLEFDFDRDAYEAAALAMRELAHRTKLTEEQDDLFQFITDVLLQNRMHPANDP